MKLTQMIVRFNGSRPLNESASLLGGKAFYELHKESFEQCGGRWTRLERCVLDACMLTLINDLSNEVQANAGIAANLFLMSQTWHKGETSGINLRPESLGWTISSSLGYMRFTASLQQGDKDSQAKPGISIVGVPESEKERVRMQRAAGRNLSAGEVAGIIQAGQNETRAAGSNTWPKGVELTVSDIGLHGACIALDDFNEKHGYTGYPAFTTGYFLAASIILWRHALDARSDDTEVALHDIHSGGEAWKGANVVSLKARVDTLVRACTVAASDAGAPVRRGLHGRGGGGPRSSSV